MNPPEAISGLQALWRPRQPLLELAVLLALGIWLGDSVAGRGGSGWIGAAALCAGAATYGSLLALLSPGSRRGVTLSFWIAALMLGVALHAGRLEHDPARRLAGFVPAEGTVFAGSGVVDEKPVPGRSRVSVRLESGVIHGSAVPTGGRLFVQWPKAELPAYGDRVEFRGTLRNLGRAKNPGGFDTLTIRKRQGVYSSVSVRYTRDVEIIAHGRGNPIIALALRSREAMEQAMSRGLEEMPEVMAVIQSTVLGTQADASEELLDLFRNTGTIHLFSVSGLHVAMLAALVFGLLRTLGVPRRIVAVIVIPVLWGYCFITGLPPGSVRATVMGTVAMLGIALERPSPSWNAFGAAAVAILLVDTDQLFRPGFQLSFLLVAALLAWVEPVRRRLVPLTEPDPYLPRLLWSRGQRWRAAAGRAGMASLAVSLVAWVSAAPVTLWYFHLWSPSTVPANLVAVALSWFILALGLASGLIGGLWAGFTLLLNQLNAFFTKALLASLAFFAGLPGGHRFVEWPEWGRHPVCEIESLDLAGGSAILLRLRIEGERRDWLIDCGAANQFRWTLLPYLRSRGVNRLDGLILTHGDSRHIGGTPALLGLIPVREIFDSSRRDRSSTRRGILKQLEEQQRGRAILQAGDTVTLLPGVTLTALHPPGGSPLRTADDKALVLRLDLTATAQPRRILFTSDAGYTTAQPLLQNRDELRADVWIKGLHPQDPLGDYDLLAAIRPEVTVVQSAPFPRAQQPSGEWVEAVENAGSRLYLQHEAGAVRIRIGADGSLQSASYAERLLRSSSR